MKLAGNGRILLWNGGSLWVGRSGESTDFHAHHAVQIALSLTNESLSFRSPDGNWSSHAASMIAAHHLHAFEGGEHFVAMIFVEPESRSGKALQTCCSAIGILPIDSESLYDERAALLEAYQSSADDSRLISAAQTVISRLAPATHAPLPVLDVRIQKAIDLIRRKIDGTVVLSDIAEAVCLSPDRFRHLFLEQTGVRFRPYVLWLRIEIALAAYSADRSLTEASQAGGFADSAHFTRTFKSMFGIVPSSIQID